MIRGLSCLRRLHGISARLLVVGGDSREPDPKVTPEIGRLQAIAASRGTSLAGLALGWLLADERVTQLVIGPGRPEHLAPVAEALRQPVTGAERAEIEAAVAGLS